MLSFLWLKEWEFYEHSILGFTGIHFVAYCLRHVALCRCLREGEKIFKSLIRCGFSTRRSRKRPKVRRGERPSACLKQRWLDALRVNFKAAAAHPDRLRRSVGYTAHSTSTGCYGFDLNVYLVYTLPCGASQWAKQLISCLAVDQVWYCILLRLTFRLLRLLLSLEKSNSVKILLPHFVLQGNFLEDTRDRVRDGSCKRRPTLKLMCRNEPPLTRKLT